MKRYLGISAAAAAVVIGIGLNVAVQPALGQSDGKDLVYELRTYTSNEGKLDALHARFRDHTMRLFEKHGMKNIAYWTPVDQENTLIYVITHESQEAAKANWRAFGSDPAWREVFKASRADGALVKKVESVFMKPTDYSPVK